MSCEFLSNVPLRAFHYIVGYAGSRTILQNFCLVAPMFQSHLGKTVILKFESSQHGNVHPVQEAEKEAALEEQLCLMALLQSILKGINVQENSEDNIREGQNFMFYRGLHDMLEPHLLSTKKIKTRICSGGRASVLASGLCKLTVACLYTFLHEHGSKHATPTRRRCFLMLCFLFDLQGSPCNPSIPPKDNVSCSPKILMGLLSLVKQEEEEDATTRQLACGCLQQLFHSWILLLPSQVAQQQEKLSLHTDVTDENPDKKMTSNSLDNSPCFPQQIQWTLWFHENADMLAQTLIDALEDDVEYVRVTACRAMRQLFVLLSSHHNHENQDYQIPIMENMMEMVLVHMDDVDHPSVQRECFEFFWCGVVKVHPELVVQKVREVQEFCGDVASVYCKRLMEEAERQLPERQEMGENMAKSWT